MQPTPEYGFEVKLDVAYDEAVRRTTAALKEEGSVVSVVDPVAMLGIIENPTLRPVADEARERLRRVARRLRGGS